MTKPMSQAEMNAALTQANLQNRAAVLQAGVNMTQQIYSSGLLAAPTLGQVYNVPMRNVGLLKRLVIEITGTITQTAAETHTRTKFGPANILSQIVFTDLSNQTRINTTGWHLHFLATARRSMAYGAAFTNDSSVQIGSVFQTMTMPASVTTAQSFRFFYELPISYSDTDLRGAIYMNVVNATANLQFTLNPNFFLASTADETLGVYKSSIATLGSLTNVTFIVYANYLDQIPIVQQNGQSQPLLPLLDLSYNYLLNNTAVTAIAVNQDNPVNFANFRNFMSCFLVYDNVGLNAGTDVSRLKLQSANYTNLYEYDPFYASLLNRNLINDDFPAGVYYFDFRAKPLATIQYGNMQIILNPSAVTSAAAQMLVGYEMLAISNQVTNAGSLYAGG